MLKQSRIHKLWDNPICVSIVEDSISKPLNDKLMDFLLEYEKTGKGQKRSNRGGYQTLPWLCFEQECMDDRIQELKNVIIESFKEVFPPQFTGSWYQLWGSMNRHNDYNDLHTHGNSDISGIYYVRTPKNCGRLVFKDPRPAAEFNSFIYKLSSTSGDMYQIDPTEGMIIFFPSYLAHMVRPNESKEIRANFNFDFKMKMTDDPLDPKDGVIDPHKNSDWKK